MSLFQIDAGKEWRGGQRQSLLLAEGLKRKGYPFFLVVQPDSPLFERAREKMLPVIPLKMRSELDALAVVRLARKMKKMRCCLVHFHDAHSVTLGSAAASLAKVPIRVVSRKVDFAIKKNPVSQKKYTKDIDCIIAISEGVKKVLVEGGIAPDMIKVIPDGIDFTPYDRALSSDYIRRELSFAPDDFLVGIVAHLADHKGHKYLIDATKILKEKAPKIKVIIVGDGPLKMQLTRQVSDIHVENMVFYLGYRDDVPQILASLDLFVLSSYLEGMGSSLLDAMACRLPIVATQVGGIPEVVTHNQSGILVPPRDARALAHAILRLYGDKETARLMGEKGYETVHKKFSAEAMAERVIEVYESLSWKKRIRLDG